MPTYSFVDTETGEEFDLIMKYSEREEFLQENPNIKLLLSAPMIVGGVSIRDKMPSGFKEVLSKVGSAHPSSKVGQEYGNKTIKSVRSEQVVKKHVDRVVKRMNNR